MVTRIERGEHPGIQKFRTLKRVAETAVDRAYLNHPEANEEQKIRLAGDLSWALLCLRHAVGGDAKTVWRELSANIRNFPNSPES